MKFILKLLLIIFYFQTLVNADHIKEFQLEGVSIGDSLLDHFSDDEIKKKIKDVSYTKNRFSYSEFEKKNFSFKKYDALHVYYKKKDENFIIEAIDGIIDFGRDNCSKDQKQISEDIFLKIIDNQDIEKFSGKILRKEDKTGESYGIYTNIMTTKGELIVVECNIWSKKFKFINNLRVRLISHNFN